MASGMAALDSSFSLSFDILRGLATGLKTTGEKCRVPGLDGYGAQTLGGGDGEFDFETISYEASEADAEADRLTAESAQYKVVTITDDWGNTYANILIESVLTNARDTKIPVIWNGNPNAVRLTIRWHGCTTQ